MDAPEIIVGLDIGTTKIACLVGRKTDHGKIEILGIGKAPSLGVRRGVVSNIEKTVQSIRAAVDEAESKSGIEIKVVNVGIAGQHIKSLQHRGMITRDSIEEEISFDLAKRDSSGEVILTENGTMLLSEMKLQPKVMKRNVIDTDGRPTFLDDLLGEL